ncbi:MAG: MFS transporter, partial [Candidatus Eremiobacteraeota bacterium]|nr:MFS transporter [Candidatus Eremiobacteraeota bacterium]
MTGASPFAHRNLAVYYAAFLCTEAAGQIQGVAVAWSVYGINHRALDLGLVGLLLFLPSLLLVLVTGHVADRYDRKRVVLAAAACEFLCTLSLAGIALAHVRNLPLTLAIVFVLGTASAFGTPAERTMLVSIVERSDFMRAQARYSSFRELLVIAAPALGGALVAISEATAFLATAALLVVAMSAFFVLRVPARTQAPDRTFSLDTALDGIRFIRAHPILLGAISLDLFAVLFGGADALLPIFAIQILHVGAFGFGLLASSSSVGSTVMAFVLSHRPPHRRVGPTLLMAVAGFGIATVVFAFSRNLALSFAAFAAGGAFDMVSVVIRNALIQLNTPDEMRGRVNAVENVFIGASNQLGAFESGTLAQFVGAVPAVALGGLAPLAVVAVWAVAFP